MSTLHPVQSPVLVGRDEFLDLADRRLAEAATGTGRVLLVAGEAGIGKTRLVRAIRRRAVAVGFRDAQGDLGPQDPDVPVAVIRDLARSMREVPALADVGHDILARCTAAASDGVYSRTLVLDLVDRLCGAVDAPTVLTFEDVQWADDLSLEAIGELARAAERLPLMVIVAYRRDETPPGTPLRDWRARLLTQRLAEEIRLERLTEEQTAMVVTLLLGTGLPAPRDLVRAVYARSDGLPLHIEELIAAARATGSVDAASIRLANVPDTIEDAVLARTARRTQAAQAAARAGSVIGRCFTPDVLAGVMDVPVTELEAPLRELVDHAILFGFGVVDVGYYDFRHQLLREALYDSTPDRDRRRFHARAGEFEALQEGASEVHASLHYERAGLREQAFRAALVGAGEAARLSAHREAFGLYQRAVANVPGDLPDLERAELLEAYAGQAAAIEENDIAERVTDQAATAYRSAGHPERAILALGVHFSVWRRMGRPLSDRRALLEAIEREVTSLPPSPTLDEVRRYTAFDRVVIEVDAMELEAARATARTAAAAAREAGDEGLELAIAIRLGMVEVIEGDVGHGLATMYRIADEARTRGHEETGVTAFRDTAVHALRVFDYEEAQRSLAEGLAYADSIQQSHCAHVMDALGAEVDWAAGRWDDAVRTAEQAVVDRGCRRAPAMARVWIGAVAFGRGEVGRARAALLDALAFGDGSEMIELRLPPRWGLAETALAAGDPTDAVRWCEEAATLARSVGERAAFVPFVVVGIRAYHAAGHPDEAARWLRDAEAYLASTPAFGVAALHHGRGLVALAAGSTGSARTELEAAVASWDACGRLWEASFARLDLATCLARSNRFATAVSLAGQIRAVGEQLGSPALVARADELVRQGRGRIVDAEPWQPLTAREFAVARLIAEGRTNVEIADELGIAPKTASSHVEHILAKLGASRRAEIAVWASAVERSAAAH